MTEICRKLHEETIKKYFLDQPITFIQLIEHLAKKNQDIKKSELEQTAIIMLLQGALKYVIVSFVFISTFFVLDVVSSIMKLLVSTLMLLLDAGINFGRKTFGC